MNSDGVMEHPGTIKEPQMQYVSYHNYGSYLNVNNYKDTKKNHATIVKLIATLTRAIKPQFSNLVLKHSAIIY